MTEQLERARTSLWDLEQQIVDLVEFRDSAESAAERAAAEQAIAEYVKLELTKVDNIRAYMRHCQTMAAGAKEEKQRQEERQRIWQNRYDSLKAMVQAAMESVGKTKIEGRTGHFAIKGNGGPKPLIVDDATKIPNELCDFVKTPRMAEVRAKLESGQDVPGVRLGDRGTHLEAK